MVAWSSASPIGKGTKSTRRQGATPAVLAALAIPILDATMLLVAVGWFGREGRFGLAYGVTAPVVLLAAGTRRARVNPTIDRDLPGLLGRLAVPFLLVAGLALLLGRGDSLPDLTRVGVAAVVLVPVGRAVAY